MWRMVAVFSWGPETIREHVGDLREGLGRRAHSLLDLLTIERELDTRSAEDPAGGEHAIN